MRDLSVSDRRARRAVVVEEYVMQRNRAAQLVSEELGVEVVNAFATLAQFYVWLKGADRSLWPHLLVVGYHSAVEPAPGSLRDLDFLAAVQGAGTRILLLSALRNRTLARRLTSMNIDAIVSTADSEHDFVLAADAVLAGRSMVTPYAQALMVGSGTIVRLGHQEERALALYATGMTISEVAQRIDVKPDTARKYLKRVRDKFTAAGHPARTKLDLARIAWAEGYVVPTRAVMTPDTP